MSPPLKSVSFPSFTSHFDSEKCWVTNKSGAIVLRGTVLRSHCLYALSLHSPRVEHAKPKSSPCLTESSTALLSTRVPDLETWHRRLGHCSTDAIVDMARKGVVQGMRVDLSTAPPRCDHCILGKQTRSPVPKIREGLKASRPLECVFVDLCGPMPCASCSGHLYSMNLIDDFSSYVWSLPLRSKDESSSVLQLWHRAMVNQTDHRLKTLVSDNGELVSKSMREWTSMHGIEHVMTAPYTSAQNGRAECLHRTLLGRVRAMRLSCNAPTYLWDEFCATAAYLTNLTTSSTLQGRTPYEVWTGRVPSLSHLREIGCRAFALIQTHNPKIYQRSRPCILIGYAPHAKAYRLWDVTSGAVFNSFHVTFLEHLDRQPFDLLPGMTITLNLDAPPSWDMPPPSEPPSNTVSTLPSPSTLDSSLPNIPASTSSSPTLPPSPVPKPSSSVDTTSSLR